MGLASELCYGGYTIFTHYGMRYCDSFTMAYWTFLIAGIASLFLADGPALLSALAEPRTGLAALGLMVMGTALPFTLYTKGLETVESGKAAIIANIEPRNGVSGDLGFVDIGRHRFSFVRCGGAGL